MKTFLKTLLVLILTTAFLLTGCATTDVSSKILSDTSVVSSIETPENLLPDEEALSIVNDLAEKADTFRHFMYVMAEEFGADLLDGLETFEAYDFLYAEYHLENLLKHLDNEMFYKKFDKDIYDFSSVQEIYDYIKTFALTTDYNYGVGMVFMDRDGKLFYNTQEMSPIFFGVSKDFKVLNKTENEIFFSTTRLLNDPEPIEFSIVKNGDGEWRLNWSYFTDYESHQLQENRKKEIERVATAILSLEIGEFESYQDLSPDDIFRIWQAYIFDGTNQEFDSLYFSKDGNDYFYPEQFEEFAKKHFRVDAEELRQSEFFDETANAYRRLVYSGKSGKLEILNVVEHPAVNYYYFEFTAAFTNDTCSGVFTSHSSPSVTVHSMELD